ncbi:WD repeat-containing protein 81-like [Lineus longissimus]|uniref:WD repeat-containing protein 81-like n=1 Tax=Lineus longissimus TaxID=88925 RepID=UPI002B4EB446
MDEFQGIQKDLKLLEVQCRSLSERRFLALVHEDWLRCMKTRGKGGVTVPVHPSIDSDDIEAYLALSCKVVPKPWSRITIKVIKKEDKLLSCPCGKPKPTIDPEMGYIDLMSTLSKENYKNSWAESHKNYNCHYREETMATQQKPYNDVIRESLATFFKYQPQALGRQLSGPSHYTFYPKPVDSASVLSAIALFESETAFYVLQPYVTYTLHDLLTFSPAILEKSYAKPSFILYQVLQLIKLCLESGRSIRKLQLHDLLIDDKLWVSLALPSVRSILQQCPVIENATESSQNNSIRLSPANETTANVTSLTPEFPLTENIPDLVQDWVHGSLSNYQYLMTLNRLAGRRIADPNHHPVLPWVTDFTRLGGNLRDLTLSKFRLNKGDSQLDITYDVDGSMLNSGEGIPHIPHHISDVLSDITYYVYKARRTSKNILCTHVRKKWVPHEYPTNMVRMYGWTPDECIPEFFTDATIFFSIHDDLPNLEVPMWCTSPEDFIREHMKVLESAEVSEKLHHWIDLTFGCKLSGTSAVKAKNVCLQLVDQHTDLANHGVVQLFTTPHPKRVCKQTFASQWAPDFQRKPSVIENDDGSLKKDLESLTAALQVFGEVSVNAEKDSTLSELRPRSRTGDGEQIILPDNYNPLALLERIENLFEYSSKTMLKLPQEQLVSASPKEDPYEKILTCTMQEFGCLMVEVFMAHKLRMISSTASLKERYQVIRQLTMRDWKEIPRPIRQAVLYLLEPSSPWDPEECQESGPLFTYKPYTFSDLPSPTPGLLLHPVISPLPFPSYFKDLFEVLQKLHKEDERIAQIAESDLKLQGKNLQILQLQREKVYTMSEYLVVVLSQCGQEGIDLILPNVKEMFDNLDTTVPAAWALFNHIARALGPKETANQLLPSLMRLYDGDYSTQKHLKLYHRSYLKQLIIRLGLQTFLAHFSTLLIEAVAGYKDFPGECDMLDSGANGNDRVDSLITPRTPVAKLSNAEIESELQRQLIEAHSKVRRADSNHLDILVEVTEKDGISPPASATVETPNETSPESCEYELDDHLADNILLEAETMRSLSPSDRERNLSDAGSFGEAPLDKLGQDEQSNSSEEKIKDDDDSDESEDALSQSVGRLSVHSVSRLIDSSRERHESGSIGSMDGEIQERRESSVFDDEMEMDDIVDIPSTDGEETTGSKENDKFSDTEDLDAVDEEDILDGDDMIRVSRRIVRSETEEFTASLMESTSAAECNICDVAADSVKWFSHKLGPLLTAKFLSRNLLRMLALCYLGDEQMVFIHVQDDAMSASHRKVVGDQNASRILDCLSHIAILYGEQVIMLQYLPHAIEMVAIAQRKLNSRSEAGLVGVLSLLTHILPYLSDTTLMDNLEDMIFNNIMLPLLRLASSGSVSFPSGGHARSVICYKFIDVLYLIGLRIGFEMTRNHMTPMLTRFFASFDRVFSYRTPSSETEETVGATSNGQAIMSASEPTSDLLEDNVFCEIKMDSKTKEYKIGTPVRLDQIAGSHGSFQYSLSPPVSEEKDDDNHNTPTAVINPRDRISDEMKWTFTPELAHTAYIPFCKLAGGIHMEQNLLNDDLIRRLCASHDEALSKQQVEKQDRFSDEESSCAGTPTVNWFVDWGTPVEKVTLNSQVMPDQDDDLISSGSFGQNVALEGNKITIQEGAPKEQDPDVTDGPMGHKVFELPNPAQLKSTEIEKNKTRHLKGNWLAYWEHELGLDEKGSTFNFKQIKLQTYSGHTNSVRAIYSMDNENSFITASKDKTVKLWAIRSNGDGSMKSGCQWTYTAHKKSVFAVTFLESIRVAATCDSTVHLWDPFVGMGIKVFETNKNAPVTVLAPMPAPSANLITATTDGTLRFLDVRMTSYAQEFKCTMAQAGLIRCVTVSPNSNWVAIGYSTGIISILDVRTGLLLGTWKGHEGEILQIKAYNSNSFITSSFDHTMSLWGTDDGKIICNFKGQTEPVHCFSFYKNEIISATTGNRVGVYTSVNSQASFSSTKLRSDTFRGVLTTMNILPLNRFLLLGADNGTVRLLC